MAHITGEVPRTILHVPNSSREIPAEVRDTLLLTDAKLGRELDRLTDHYTDKLFDIEDPTVSILRFPMSRFVVDPERFAEDADEPVAGRGQGAIYMQTTDARPLGAHLHSKERQLLLDRWYRPHHAALEARTRAALDVHGQALMIDGHSFPNKPLPVDLDQTTDRPDVCLGTDSFHTQPALVGATRDFLERQGYSVGINRPYAGTLVPTFAWQRDARVTSIMVEVNRRLYLVEEPADVRKSKDFDDIAWTIGELVETARSVAGVL